MAEVPLQKASKSLSDFKLEVKNLKRELTLYKDMYKMIIKENQSLIRANLDLIDEFSKRKT
jgi:histidinol phosphatase-like enzyme